MTRSPLSPGQLRAATTRHQLTYVKAGPGSGKTYLATESFGYLRLVRHRGDPRGVVGITFARSARSELAERVRLRWGRRVRSWPNGVWTFDELNRQLLTHLCHKGILAWPGDRAPLKVEDSWESYEGATTRPGQKPRMFLTLDDEGNVVPRQTRDKRIAPSPVFTDASKFVNALKDGQCTHNEIRGVLGAAVDASRHPAYNVAIREFMATRFCHLLIDEAFDMNPLDCSLVERAIEANVPVTIVGDPWQSLYKFRGSSPERVEGLIQDHGQRLESRFVQIDMPGSRRYETDSMKELSLKLFNNEPFQVKRANSAVPYDIAIAHDWAALWAERRLTVLPGGRPSRMDSGKLASAFVLLLQQANRRVFGCETSGAGEATRNLDPSDEDLDRLDDLVELLATRQVSAAAALDRLREIFQPTGSGKWKDPGTIALDALNRTVDVLQAGERLVRGVTVHQAKGLEWPNVLVLDDLLTTDPDFANVLSIEHDSHRSLYVALTRAKRGVWHADPSDKPWGVDRQEVRRVPFRT